MIFLLTLGVIRYSLIKTESDQIINLIRKNNFLGFKSIQQLFVNVDNNFINMKKIYSVKNIFFL